VLLQITERSDTGSMCYVPGFYSCVADLGQYWGLNSGPPTPLRKNMHLVSLPYAESSDVCYAALVHLRHASLLNQVALIQFPLIA
jgi:hypothetical protein